MHLFISYAKADTPELAKSLYDELKDIPGVTVWMDTSMGGGEDWVTRIQQEIDKADHVIVLLSPDVNRGSKKESPSFVINETLYAQSKNKSIIPVMAKKTDLPLPLQALNFLDVSSVRGSKAKTEKLVLEIIKITGLQIEEDSIRPRSPKIIPQIQNTVAKKTTMLGLLAIFFVAIVIAVAWIVTRDGSEDSTSPPASAVDGCSSFMLQDDFSDNSNGWELESSDMGATTIEDGRLVLSMNPNVLNWATVPDFKTCDDVDFVLQIEAVDVETESFVIGFGLGDKEGLPVHRLAVSKECSGECTWQFLSERNYVTSRTRIEPIWDDDARFSMRLSKSGNTYRFEIDDKLVGDIEIDDFEQDVGVLVINQGSQSITVYFDNLELEARIE